MHLVLQDATLRSHARRVCLQQQRAASDVSINFGEKL